MATTFGGEGDASNPDSRLACWKYIGKKFNDRLDDKKDFLVAHRTLPCGTSLIICNPRTKKCATARVGDRGPFGKTKGKYRAGIDLSTAVAKSIHFNGMEKVLIWKAKEGFEDLQELTKPGGLLSFQ